MLDGVDGHAATVAAAGVTFHVDDDDADDGTEAEAELDEEVTASNAAAAEFDCARSSVFMAAISARNAATSPPLPLALALPFPLALALEADEGAGVANTDADDEDDVIGADATDDTAAAVALLLPDSAAMRMVWCNASNV
jgi:hypothetical protein